MKLKYLVSAIFAVCLLTACGKQNKEPSENEPTTAVTSISVSSSTAKTTKATSTTVTTTTKKAEPPADLVLKGREYAEVYDEIDLNSFITEKNVELKNGSVMLNTSDTGVFEIEVPYVSNGTEFTQKLQYSVIDVTEPTILNTGWDLSHKVHTPFDLNDYVGFADNFDKHPVLTYTGNVDPDKVGTYPLTATVTDSSGNSSTWELTINVVDDIPRPIDNNPRVNYSDFISRYKDGNVRFGIDVSVWQADVDYNAVRDAGCSFVMIRVGYYYDTVTLDERFKAKKVVIVFLSFFDILYNDQKSA